MENPIFTHMKGLGNYKTGIILEKPGDFCFDIAKLVFGGVILAAIMQLDIDTVWLFGLGFAIVLMPVIAGCLLFDMSSKKEKQPWDWFISFRPLG